MNSLLQPYPINSTSILRFYLYVGLLYYYCTHRRDIKRIVDDHLNTRVYQYIFPVFFIFCFIYFYYFTTTTVLLLLLLLLLLFLKGRLWIHQIAEKKKKKKLQRQLWQSKYAPE